MTSLPFIFFPAALLLLCIGCSSSEDTNANTTLRNQKGEYIYRKSDETLLTLTPPEKAPPKLYPWDKVQIGTYPPITKEFFRCKGSSLNPVQAIQKKEGIVHCYDCGGVEKHSLPLKDEKEFIFPILIDLLNYVQAKTNKRVVITCGHRCIEHNSYADSSIENQYSKHMIGAEVSFYVQGMEEKPEEIVKIIQDYYRETPIYQGKKDYLEFRRYEKGETNVSIYPWYNKEIFIKLFSKKEGRNFDNRHPYAYLSIQVRYDRESNQSVNYSWDKAYRNFRRW